MRAVRLNKRRFAKIVLASCATLGITQRIGNPADRKTKMKHTDAQIPNYLEVRDGKKFLVQTYNGLRITRHKTDTNMRVFKVTAINPQNRVCRQFYVPYDIARLAAGKDAWMRNLLGKCDCGANFPMHESDVPYCAKCQAEAERENAIADGLEVAS